MIVVNLEGGMGHQMFQAAAGRAMSHHYGLPLHLGIDHLCREGNTYQLDRFAINATIGIPKQDNDNLIIMHGKFQSEKYFKDYEALIRREFNIIRIPGVLEGESVAIHVRRKDVQEDMILGMEYYEKAIAYLISRRPCRFYLFSDDPQWIKTHLPGTVISCGKLSDYEELCLMSQCTHQIIANSSFSWWAAWLNRNEQKIVVAPAPSDDDIVPKEWVRF